MLRDEKYVSEESVKVGTKSVKKKGFFAAIARVFGGGYETVGVYKDQEFVALKQLIQDQVTEVQHSFDKEMNAAVKDTESRVETFKNAAMTKLEGLDQMVKDLMEDIDKMLSSQDELQARVQENADKAKWIKDFIKEVDDLLTI